MRLFTIAILHKFYIKQAHLLNKQWYKITLKFIRVTLKSINNIKKYKEMKE